MGKYIKFTGEYAKLKELGYVFQKLFANNYMQWNNNGFRVWKKGAELTIDKFTNYEGAVFELLFCDDDLDVTTLLKRIKSGFGERLPVFINTKTGEASFDRNGYREQMRALDAYYKLLDEKFPFSAKGYETQREKEATAAGYPVPPYDWNAETIVVEDIEILINLYKRGWIELGEYDG